MNIYHITLLVMALYSHCGGVPLDDTAEPCLDRGEGCKMYVRAGYCKNSSTSTEPAMHDWTKRNCKLSCQLCKLPKIAEDNLDNIVKKIEESVSSLFEIGKQCVDHLGKCKKYKSLGYCYHPTIKKYCKVSCKVCVPGRYVPVYWNCKDSHPDCKMFSFLKRCDNSKKADREFGKKNCRFSCKYCKRPKTNECGNPKLRTESSIVSGKPVTAGHYPWQAAIYFDGDLLCGGSLFSERYVLSAAHCFRGLSDRKHLFKVVLGEHDREKFEGNEQQMNVQNITIHEAYENDTQKNDIAILKLDGDADLSNHIDLVCLPKENEELLPGKNCTITGWGSVFHMEEQATILQEITVPIVESRKCKKRNKIGVIGVTDKMLCTGFADGMTIKSACKGDSGGPLSCEDENKRFKLYGIVSWGSTQCNALENYNVFTKVSAYVPWIQKQLAILMG